MTHSAYSRQQVKYEAKCRHSAYSGQQVKYGGGEPPAVYLRRPHASRRRNNPIPARAPTQSPLLTQLPPPLPMSSFLVSFSVNGSSMCRMIWAH
jgi:hypothetical protein